MPSPGSKPNYITAKGLEALQAEYDRLYYEERPKLLKVIEWAAGNGDRSENADYIYGKRRLREIDRRLTFLGKRIKDAEVVKRSGSEDANKVFFGAKVTIEDEEGGLATYQIVGEDEVDAKVGRISWQSPMGKALLGKRLDEEVTVQRPAGPILVTITEIIYELD